MTPWTVAHQAPPSMEFSKQEYWSGLLFPSPGDLPDPGTKLRSPALQADTSTIWAMVFPIVMYGCENWTIKKAERWRTDAFELRCLRRLFRIPRTARRSNQSVLKEISPEYSLEGLMLKLQYFCHLVWRADSLEKILMLGKIKGRRRRGWQRDKMVGWHHWLSEHELGQTPRDSEGQGSLVCCSPWGHRIRHDWVTEQQ